MNLLLEKLAGVAARRHWIFIIAWVVVLGALLGAKQQRVEAAGRHQGG